MIKLFFMPSEKAVKMPSGISEYRKNKILCARGENAKKSLIAAAEVLKAGFTSFGIDEEKVKYGFSASGKPYALSHPKIHFSLSHSENTAVAVFSDSPVGVDCEKADRSVSEKLIKRVFGWNVPGTESGDALLLWVAGESLSKLSGDGVFGGEKRTPAPIFEGNRAYVGSVTLERLCVNGNLAVVASESGDEVSVNAV